MSGSLPRASSLGDTDRRNMKASRGGVAVFARIRPTANFARGLIECPDGQTVNIYHRTHFKKLQDSKKGQLSSWSFRLDGVLQDTSQKEVYARVGRRVVQGVLDGYNGTVMCFGQTGSGKTYTMTGSTQSYKQRGIIPRALQEVFREVEKRTEHSFSVHLSYLEVYNETLVDMLSPLQGSADHPSPGIVVMEEPGRGVTLRGLSLHPVHSEEEALNLLFEGEMNRIIGSHAMNRIASRSHCIFTIYIEILCDPGYITSKLNLVDLAGSERLGKTGSEGQVFKEATYINKSLSFLEQVILALGDPHRDHVPFRQTTLTHALKDSLGGNCNTVLVANIYGEAAQLEETLSTLRFASRMKCVQSDPMINEHMAPALQIKKLEKQVQVLKEELSIYNTLANRPGTICEPLSEAQLAEISSQVRRYLDGSLKEISITSITQVHAMFAQFKLAMQEEKQRVMAQLCQTYNLLEKDQSFKTSVIQDWDIRGPCRDVEPHSLKERPGSTSAKPKPMKSRDKQIRNKSLEDGSPALMKQLERTSQSKLISVHMAQSEHESKDPDAQETQKHGSEPFYLDLPPAKAEVFENFKLNQGSKMNCSLKENKAVLLERHSLLRLLTEEVNAVKREIDCTAAAIEQHKEMQETEDQYLVKEGEPEADLLLQLKALKALYRQRYEALRSIKAEVNFCQHLVDQCRVRLLSEFETWYRKTFLLSEEKMKITMDKSLEQLENEPSNSSGAQSFYNALYRTQRRRNSKLLSFSPVQRNQSAESTQRRLLPPLPVKDCNLPSHPQTVKARLARRI